MKTVSVSLTVWFAQVLSLCALHEDHTNLLLPQIFSTATTREEKPMAKTATMTTPTTTRSADKPMSDEMPPLNATLEFTSSLRDVRGTSSIGTFHHNLMDDSANTNGATPEHREPGPGTESMGRNIQDVTGFQLNPNVQTTSASWTEDRTGNTDGPNTTIAQLPQGRLTHQTDSSSSESSLEISRNAITPAGTNQSGNFNSSATHFTQSYAENTEEPLVSTTKRIDWNMQENTEAPTTSSGIVKNDRTNTTWRNDAENTDTRDTWTTTLSTNISTSKTETPAGTSATINTKVATDRSSEVTSREHVTDEALVSTTKLMDWRTQENTEAQRTTIKNMTNTTWSTNSRDTWSTFTSENISTLETETPPWTNCFSAVSSSQLHRSSNRMCFITMWSLGMTASFFLGLTVFLWVRLSSTRKRARQGLGPSVKETESLWAEPDSSTEERVEFWYANGDTVEEDRGRKKARQVRERETGEEDTDMWIQPKVTMKDITEFWNANRRVRE